MLSNEVFALACRAYYEEQGLIVDETNGEFAHCPQPERYGDAGYYLLHEHHQQQGLLQSQDIRECCFFIADALRWLKECNYFPENYFELWDIYDTYSSIQAKLASEKAHKEKNEEGKSVNAIKAAKKAHEEKDELGRSLHNMKMHQQLDKYGRSSLAVKMSEKANAKKDELGRSLTIMKTVSQVWESTVDGFRSTPGGVTNHNKARGWDPNARVRIA